MDQADDARRRFLIGGGQALGLGWLAANWPAVAAAHQHARPAEGSPPPALGFLSDAEAATFTAMAAQIVPSDDTPGAREAGVVYFADRACKTFYAEQAEGLRQGLARLEADYRAQHPGASGFAEAPAEQQVAYLHSIEDSAFFGDVRMLTILGLLSLPQYGGNRDDIGFKMIGFDDSHIFQPPFGDYDRGYPGWAAAMREKP